MTDTPINFDDIVDGMKGVLVGQLRGLAEGSIADIEKYAGVIAADFSRAAMIPDATLRDARIAELKGQLLLIAEKNRITLGNAAYKQFYGVAQTAIETLVVVLKALL